MTLMPIIAAASMSCDVARIAFPCFVERTSHVSASRDRDRQQQHRRTCPTGSARRRSRTRPGSGSASVDRALDAVPDKPDVLEDERHPDGGDQRRQARRTSQPAVGDRARSPVFSTDANTTATRSATAIPSTIGTGARAGAEPEPADDHAARDEPAEREHVAVREVDQLEDAVDERVAERHERVDRPVRQADERDVEELGRVVDEVRAEREDEQCRRTRARASR